MSQLKESDVIALINPEILKPFQVRGEFPSEAEGPLILK